MKTKYLITSIIFILISMIFHIFSNKYDLLILFSIISLITSLIFFIKFILFEINIINNDCDPKLFFERNKNKKSQLLNCGFALYHLNDDNIDLLEEYIEKANKKFHKSNLEQMKIDYLKINYKQLKNEEIKDDLIEFKEKWETNKFLSVYEQHYINKFLVHKSRRFATRLDSVIYHFELGLNYLELEKFEQAHSEFIYVSKFGGTTFYKRIADEHLKNLEEYEYKSKYEIKERMHLNEIYKFYKYTINACFCLYFIIYGLIIGVSNLF